jgi:hypothetical protein
MTQEQAAFFYKGLEEIEMADPGIIQSGKLKSYLLICRDMDNIRPVLIPLNGIEEQQVLWQKIEALFERTISVTLKTTVAG